MTQKPIDFKRLFLLMKAWFDWPAPEYDDFDRWRRSTYEAQEKGLVKNLPFKTWWPKYTEGDFRLELCIGALLVPQVSWYAVKKCIRRMDHHLKKTGTGFNLDGILALPQTTLADLIQDSRFTKQKSERIQNFCRFVQEDSGTIENFFRRHSADELDRKLKDLKAGFGSETRDCVLLYAANYPIFIADAYARRLLQYLGIPSEDGYAACQVAFQKGIREDFSAGCLDLIAEEYTPEERSFALCNNPNPEDGKRVMVYQQFHAGIDELGISRQWDRFIYDYNLMT